MQKRFRILAIGASLFIVLFLLFSFAAIQEYRNNRNSYYADVSLRLSALRSQIKINLESRIRLLDPYVTHMTSHGDADSEGIQQLGRQLVVDDELIKNILSLKIRRLPMCFRWKVTNLHWV